MGVFVKGDIVVLPFPFSDLSASKKRPALVLVSSQGDDVILCQITSRNVRDIHAIIIDIDDVKNGSLRAMSNVRPNKLFTADKRIILYKLGCLAPAKFDAVVSKIVNMLRDET